MTKDCPMEEPISTEYISRKLYRKLIATSNEAFKAGLFDVSYHSLEAAFYCADYLKEDGFLQEISNLARTQLAFIDEHHSDYRHSSRSTSSRQHPNIFLKLAERAKGKVITHSLNRRYDGSKNSVQE